MARYLATRDTWLSHECRLVKAGEEFDAEFPAHMKLGENLALVQEGGSLKAVKPGKGQSGAADLT